MNKITDMRRLVKAFKYSLKGLKAAWASEAAFRQEVVAFLIAIPVSLLITRNIYQIAMLLGSILFVMIVELLNSAVESAIDRIGTERHELSGQAKDMGSAAVLLASVLALTVWLLVIWSRFS